MRKKEAGDATARRRGVAWSGVARRGVPWCGVVPRGAAETASRPRTCRPTPFSTATPPALGWSSKGPPKPSASRPTAPKEAVPAHRDSSADPNARRPPQRWCDSRCGGRAGWISSLKRAPRTGLPIMVLQALSGAAAIALHPHPKDQCIQ